MPRRLQPFASPRLERDQTRLSHFRNRHYSAEHGRFLQEDPIGFAGGLNLYAYAGNDPATFTDPFGLCGLPGAAISVGIGAALGVVTGGYSLAGAGVDAATGAACVGALSKAAKVGKGASKLLRRALVAVGEVVRHGNEAHHIAAAGAKGARGARQILVEFGIDINDVANGVFLPKDFHRHFHTTAYYREVTERLSAASTKQEAIEILRTLRNELIGRAR